MYSCKEVSRLVSESLDRKLPFWQRMQLWLHLKLCRLCSRFSKDLGEIDETAREYAEQFEDPAHGPAVQLPAEARERLRRALGSGNSEN